MFLEKWINYLSFLKNNQSILKYTTDFLSYPTYLEMVKGDTDILLNYCNFLISNISPIYRNNAMENVFSDLDYYSIFSHTNYFTEKKVQIFNLETIASDIERLSTAKNDVDALCGIFPSHEDVISELDTWVKFGDESLQYVDSTPDTKLYYPEPFIASPSFIHEEVWFIHILHYQHWLWFMFISLVMFYFITFINVVRWCNLRTKPKRETRGVSRSKCADVITAIVPVSWAASIIISETVDASDYYDGFGTGEIVIGIRAYQWGWEYFYPKGIDLSYNVKPSYSSLVGNSIKYNNSSSLNTESNSIWKSYQNKTLQSLTNAPASVLISPSDKSNTLNLSNFSKAGLSTLKDSSAFKKIQYHSKVNPHSIYSESSNYSYRYGKLNNLYLNSSNLNDSHSYGTMRQQGYSTALADSTAYGLEFKSVDKMLNYNYGVVSDKGDRLYSNALSPLSNPSNSSYLAFNLYSCPGSNDKHFHHLVNSTKFNILGKSLSTTTDSKYYSNPFKFYLGGNNNISSLTFGSEVMPKLVLSSPSDNLTNASRTYKFKDLKSGNLSFLSADKNSRGLDELSLSKSNVNLMSHNNNLSSLVSSTIDKNASANETSLYNSSLAGWSNEEITEVLKSSNISLTPSHTPIYSNKNSWSDKGFDRFQKGFEDLGPSLLKSKEETAPSYLFSAYWSTFWQNTKSSHRFSNMSQVSEFKKQFYLPSINDYADYDFKNWSSLELLEDAFWESTFSSFSQDEYLNILQTNNEYSIFKKQEELFNLSTRLKKFRNSAYYKPMFKYSFIDNSISNSLPVYTEDAVVPTNLITRNNFSTVPLESSTDLMEDSLDASKSAKYRHFNSYSNTSASALNGLQPYSYASVLDPFRADYEDCVWSYDTSDLGADSFDHEVSNQDLKASNSMKLRSTARNSIVTYNAIQKVFKSRLDEGRSHSRLQDFSNSYVSHPFVSSEKSPYESMLGKNKESFFDLQAYNHSTNTNFNVLFSVWNSLNSSFLDVPFLISATSDPSRYLWFDWKSRWSSIEVQPSSVARYSLSGVPYFNKSYEYDSQKGDDLNESENYVNRLARARKNYMPNWAHTPYFYSRVSNWYNQNLVVSNSYSDLGSTKLLLKQSSSYWTSLDVAHSTSSDYTPSSSGVNTPAKASWRPLSGVQAYYSNSSILVDILTKREFLYRSYFNSKSYIANLPVYLTASPNNSLLIEVQKGYNLVDPVSFSSEISRELMYQNLNFMKFNLLRDAITSTGINTQPITNYLFYYLFDSNMQSRNIGSTQELYKNQYRPLKKGITNMVRLHATGAVAMPIEIRLHILASSRDVIHSWAIPSAGIKIDCVPGYSSHRVTIFLVSGIFWGQCMEICGRFHHWMPIVVYFMKRDLFFLWCTHFMHYSPTLDIFDTTDKQLADKLKCTSFDKTSWVNEINKIF